MKKRFMNSTFMEKKGFLISGGVAFVAFLIFGAVYGHLAGKPVEQQMASRWSEKNDVAQVSCFFANDAYITPDQIEDFEHTLDSKLLEASVTGESANPDARLWADAYSAGGRITLSRDRTSVDAEAIGIGGDFFLFHPYKLLSGSYFSGNDLNHDYCVIDEDMAWQLFGSNDVAGMMVYIGGVPHIVTGVVERPTGHLEEAAGLSATVVYVSYQTLTELGIDRGINHYEIVMPDPVSGFALKMVKEGMIVDEKQVEILENTSRYSLFNEIKVIGAFGTRSMNGKAIIYPHWENVARGYEDLIALIVMLMLLLFLIFLVSVLVPVIDWWKHKTWTFKSVILMLKDKLERYMEYRRSLAKKEEELEELED